METTAVQIARLTRTRDRLRGYIKGLSISDRRAGRRAIEARIDFLIEGRRRRISRGPRSQRKAGTCAGRVITFGGGGSKAVAGAE